MSKTRFTPWIVLACISALAACTSGEGGTAGNTEMNVVVPNGSPALGGGSTAPGSIDIQTVEYTINCLGNSDTFLENAASFPDEVRVEGNLEVVDGRTDPQGPIPPEFGTPRPGDGAEIWQGFMDLPPGPCTVQLRARDNDGEVICTATEPFTITADTTTKVNLVLVCDVSFQAPVGMLDVDATFSFVVSNFCPDLIQLNCLDSNPQEELLLDQFGDPIPGLPPIAATTCEVRFRDGDSQCGQSCDPQTCTVTPEGIDCVPGADPGVSTTITCTDGQIDCDFNPITTETSCTFTGDQLGVTPVGGPIVPNIPGGIVPGASGAFALACIPPALGGAPGATPVCTAVTTDGDLDCNKTKTVSINCPGSTPCQLYDEAQNGLPVGGGTESGADATCNSADGTVCIASSCDNGVCDGSTTGACCVVDSFAPSGTTCTDAPAPAECDGSGTCVSGDCNAPGAPVCDDSNPCTVDSCDPPPGTMCIYDPAPADGNACAPDPSCGPTDGTCSGGTCGGNDACTAPGDCPNTPPAPADPACTAAVCNTDVCGNTCGIDLAANQGSLCDFPGGVPDDGTCNVNGECIFTPPTCNFTQTGNDATPQAQVVSVACTNSVTTAQSPFPWTLEVDVPEPVLGGGSFDATFDGIGIFPEFFLDAAQGVVNGGVQQAILEGFAATVEVRSGATGPLVTLGPDLGALVPGPTRFCNFPASQICTADSECTGGVCNPPVNLATIPTSSDCSAGGVCDTLGKLASQCPNGFCVTGDLVVEFAASPATSYTAAASGNVLFGWTDKGLCANPGPPITIVSPATSCLVNADCGGGQVCHGAPGLCPGGTGVAPDNCAADTAFKPDGCYDIPTDAFSSPARPIGIRVNVANALFVPLQCSMAEEGGICASGEGCLVDADCATAPCTITADVACPTPDASLISCPIIP